MKTKNQKLRTFFLILVIVWVAVLAVVFIMKLLGLVLDTLAIILDCALLLLCIIMYKNYDRAVKEDKKYGDK